MANEYLMNKLQNMLINEPDVNNQIYCCIEEMSEATKCLTKYLRGSPKYSLDNLMEEIAHAMLMLDTIRQIFMITKSEIEREQLKALKKCYEINE